MKLWQIIYIVVFIYPEAIILIILDRRRKKYWLYEFI